MLPPGALPIEKILNAEIIGYIRTYPLSEQTRGYIRKVTRLILPPEVQVELNNAEDILSWVRFQWYHSKVSPGTERCDGKTCLTYLSGARCGHGQPTTPYYSCTRERGHTGDHIGCTGGSDPSQHNNQRWPQEMAPLSLAAPAAPEPVVAEETVSLRIRYNRDVTGTFARRELRECLVDVPLHVVRDGMDEVRDYLRDAIVEEDQADDELIDESELDSNTNDWEFAHLTTTSSAIMEQLEDAGVDLNPDEDDND